MKKYVIKATALAIGALVGGGAFAAVGAIVNFDSATPTVITFAQELAYVDATPMQSTNGISWKSKLGFGVSNGQTRYIRVEYGNAKLDAVHAAVAGTDISVGAAGGGDASYAKVAGGAAGDTYVIYQITANTDLSSAVIVEVLTPALRVISNSSSVTVSYQLHETAVSAVAGATGTGLLYSKSGTIAKFDTGLDFTVVKSADNTANVSDGFKLFTDNFAASDNTVAKLGVITADKSGAKKHNTTTDAAYADLVGTNTKVVVKGDFSAVAGTSAATKLANTWLGLATCVADAGDIPATEVVTGGVAFKTGVTPVAGMTLCYKVTGKAAIPASGYTAELSVDPAADSTTASVSAKTSGAIVRNGTELQAPFATIHADYLSRVVLTSQYSVDAPYVISAITEDGVTCTMGAGATGTLKAGTTKVIDVKTICASTNTGATRLAVNAVIDAPLNKVHGLYNVMNYDVTTGKTNSLISYPMVRPTEN
jgi:hypothetical protein